jgi:hypothetical protein
MSCLRIFTCKERFLINPLSGIVLQASFGTRQRRFAMSIGLIVRAMALGLVVVVNLSTLTSVHAGTERAPRNAPPSVSIANNSGGVIAQYAITAADYRNSRTLVKFMGRCDSACTLFLGLPASQTCVAGAAYFRFHAPFGVSDHAQQLAQNYLMSRYPRWVRQWINQKSGLTHQLITMDYNYASRFMRTCDAVASR